MAPETLDELTIAFESEASQDDVHALKAGLSAYNQQVLGSERYQPFRIFARDCDGQLVGGLLGDLYFEWVYIAILWVREDRRGLGVGRRLMAMAEEYAVREGRQYAHLDTFDFQAPEFYKRLGYTVHGELGPYGDGHTRIYLYKTLASGSSHLDSGHAASPQAPGSSQ